MARKVRIRYPGPVDHLMNRGESPWRGVGERLQRGSGGHPARLLEQRGKSRLAVRAGAGPLGI